MERLSQKHSGAYYTPDAVAQSLVRWAVRSPSDRLLDPSCGDGRFIAAHRRSVGIEQDAIAGIAAKERAPWSLVHEGDFFDWASNTNEQFECVAGNPPFIRYQIFKGHTREVALALCEKLGAKFSGLTSSWAPFLVVAASLLKKGGRLGFVVPAEIGHAPYSAPLIEYLARVFSSIHIVAIKRKLFPELSEDCWLLYADGHGESTTHLRFSAIEEFSPRPEPPGRYQNVSIREWKGIWNRRLRPFLLPSATREKYLGVVTAKGTQRLGDIANVGIGYVSGANSFFHLKKSDALKWEISDDFLLPTVRNGRALPKRELTTQVVRKWIAQDEAVLLLNIPKGSKVPKSVQRYLSTEAAAQARQAYKCQQREPWYSVPDVQIPDFFLTYMSGREVSFVRNAASCTCTNSVHSVRLKNPRKDYLRVQTLWNSRFVQLSCEIEGHPLGGGMLKVEPREAAHIALPDAGALRGIRMSDVDDAIEVMHRWRHYQGTMTS